MAYTVNPTRGLARLPFTALGGQPAFAPEELERFVAAPRIAILSYVRADGRPTQAPIWYAYADGVFTMSTTAGSPKARALARSGQACLAIQDERPPYRAVILDGDVELSPASVGDDGLAVRYFGRLGAAEYARLTAEEYAKTGLVTIVFRPTKVRGFDNTRALGRLTLAFMRVRDRLPIPRGWL